MTYKQFSQVTAVTMSKALDMNVLFVLKQAQLIVICFLYDHFLSVFDPDGSGKNVQN